MKNSPCAPCSTTQKTGTQSASRTAAQKQGAKTAARKTIKAGLHKNPQGRH